MAIKINSLTAIFLILFMLSSCVNSKEDNNDIKVESFFSASEEYLPNFLDSSYTLIYRMGSIEWSPYITVLAFKPETEASRKSVAFLFQFNFSIEGKRSFIYEPNYMNSFKINLENDNVKAVARLKLNTNDLRLNSYHFDGEGRCSNIYVIRKFGKSECLIVNQNSSEKNKNLIKKIFMRISPQEHFQSFSLEKNCDQFDSLAYELLKTGYIDTKYSYQIDYKEIKPIDKR